MPKRKTKGKNNLVTQNTLQAGKPTFSERLEALGVSPKALPSKFFCSITQDVMNEPATLCGTHFFDKKGLERYKSTLPETTKQRRRNMRGSHRTTCPHGCSGEQGEGITKHSEIVIDESLKQEIETYLFGLEAGTLVIDNIVGDPQSSDQDASSSAPDFSLDEQGVELDLEAIQNNLHQVITRVRRESQTRSQEKREQELALIRCNQQLSDANQRIRELENLLATEQGKVVKMQSQASQLETQNNALQEAVESITRRFEAAKQENKQLNVRHVRSLKRARDETEEVRAQLDEQRADANSSGVWSWFFSGSGSSTTGKKARKH